MPTTLTLTVTVRCGHCDHVLTTYAIDPAERPGTEAKYKWQHLTCSFCHKTMGPKIVITDPPLPAVPVIDEVVNPLTPAGA
jgi:hypothetical protein